MNNLHRNNAAEWVLYVTLLPLMSITGMWEKLLRRSRRTTER